ncbi:MAG: hypothetical protein WKF37_24435 [Bryobacteraceae bacterium]
MSVATRPQLSMRGNVYVMFRNALGGSRDLYLARSNDGKTFSAATNSIWQLNACPMDGGALVTGKNGPSTVWRRGKEICGSGRPR